jgi:flavin reductase (DIM6/NTAB) family NADH-FMN oxidoreductase RutF
MSLVPTSVSVISCVENSLIHGCTISSLVSVDVQDENPELIFVLKKQSLIGGIIETNNFFTINVLSCQQGDIAQKYSTNRSPEKISDTNWVVKNNFAEISNCIVNMNCKLLKIYDSHAANIFVGKVVKYSGDQSQSSLIYDARRYGRFQSN